MKETLTLALSHKWARGLYGVKHGLIIPFMKNLLRHRLRENSTFDISYFSGGLPQCVRWYCKYGISYRDLEEMMSERGLISNLIAKSIS